MMCRRLTHGFVIACFFALGATTGCAEKWDYRVLQGVHTPMPNLMDKQWSQRREYTSAEMLPAYAGGSQTLLIARRSKKAIVGDVAQLDEQVSQTFVLALEGPPQAGQKYRITPDNGRLIEGTTFRPSWRPYRGIEGEVTILGVSDSKIRAAVAVTALTLRHNDPKQRLSGIFSFKPVSHGDTFLAEAQIKAE